jgi:hypothetical protein
MRRVECPKCESKTIEKRAANIPQNVKLRKVKGLHDICVCRNPDCRWTGDEDELGESFGTEIDVKHEPATSWNIDYDKDFIEVGIDYEMVLSSRSGTMTVGMSREQAEELRSRLDGVSGGE